MGIVFRQSVKTSIVTFTGAFLGALTIWLSTKYIPKQQLGFTRDLANKAIVFSSLVSLGTGNVLMVFIHRYASDLRKRKLLITLCLAVPLITTFIVSAVYFLLRTWIIHHFQPDDIPLVQRYFAWLPVYTLLFTYMTVLELYLGTQMRVAVSAFMREVVVRVLNIILILLFAFQYVDFTTLVVGTVLIYIVPVFIFYLLSLKTEPFGFSLQFHDFSRTEYKEMIHFSWYHFLLVISITMMGLMDIITLPLYDHKGFSSVAIYSVAVFLISFLQIPAKAMGTATFAVLAKAITGGETARAKDIFSRSSINILIATTLVTIIICCNLENATSVINNGYQELAPVFCILLIGKYIDLSTGVNDYVLTITNYYKFNFYLSSVLLIVLFALLKFLIPIYGVVGAAWSTTITLIIFNIAKYLFVWMKLEMQPFSKQTILVVIAGLPALAAGYFLPHFFSEVRHIYVHAFMDTALRSVVVVVVYVAMLVWLKPSNDLEEYIASIKENKRLF